MNKRALAFLVTGALLTLTVGTAMAADGIGGTRTEKAMSERGERKGFTPGNPAMTGEQFFQRIDKSENLSDAEKEKMRAIYEETQSSREEMKQLMDQMKAATNDTEREAIKAKLEALKEEMQTVMGEADIKFMPQRPDRQEGERKEGEWREPNLTEWIESNQDLTAEQKEACLVALEQVKPLQEEMKTLRQQYLEADDADKAALKVSIQQLQAEIKDILAPLGQYLRPEGKNFPGRMGEAEGRGSERAKASSSDNA